MYKPIYWRCFSEKFTEFTKIQQKLKQNFNPFSMMSEVFPVGKYGKGNPDSSLSPSKSGGVLVSVSFDSTLTPSGHDFIHRSNCTAEL